MGDSPKKRWPTIEPINRPGFKPRPQPPGERPRLNPHASRSVPKARDRLFNRALDHFQWRMKRKLNRPFTYLTEPTEDWEDFLAHVNQVVERYIQIFGLTTKGK